MIAGEQARRPIRTQPSGEPAHRTPSAPAECGRPDEPRPLIYLCAAGGKGNVGAEAIMVGIIDLLQASYPNARFIITSWYPERVRALLETLEGDFSVIRRESLLAPLADLRQADFFVLCGDTSISETLVSFLPIYYALRTLTAKLCGAKVILLGIEAERITRPTNRLAVRYLLCPTTDHFVLRNEQSVQNLRGLSPAGTSLLLGCDPSLLVRDEQLAAYDDAEPVLSSSKLHVGFSLRDFFAEPLRVNPWKLRLERRDVRAGAISDTMQRIIDFTAALADHVAERHDAQLVFTSHHALHGADKVILADSEVADLVIARMRNAADTIVIRDLPHPLAVMSLYRRLDLVFSMRHHANCFALFAGTPTFGYAISEKLSNFFHGDVARDMLLDPFADDLDEVRTRIDTALRERTRLAERQRQRLARVRAEMADALAVALRLDTPVAARTT